ncbi:uncharacterized protein C3orf38 homolog [Daktulosphaira vitifoliae]|uniref:uncharacterized protein C3orf38 homolog n=1 Tax=Daktulosphaira vitifoliae TaxID=58002 RepID=UPI0021AA8F0F|nr:uncharacterized protein C3orf38 homolog [Daktulosphaira vitifoliae]
MATEIEKRLLKDFLNTLETNNLYNIARSVYRGGGINIQSREEAELLLITQPYWRILTSKKTPLTSIIKFFIVKGMTPSPDMIKNDTPAFFKQLIETQPDFTQPVVQPLRPPQFYPQQLPPLCNTNNNMMSLNPHHIVVHHMPIEPSSTKTKKEHDNELLEEFIKMFAKHYYDLFNDLGIPDKNQLDNRHFYENCTMAVRILGGSEEINETCEDSPSVLKCLLNIKQQHQLIFSPHLSDDIKWKKESHGLLKVQIGGTLHQGVGRMVGMFEQQFILREDPQAENTWKVLNTNLMMKSMDTMLAASSKLRLEGPSNLQIEY